MIRVDASTSYPSRERRKEGVSVRRRALSFPRKATAAISRRTIYRLSVTPRGDGLTTYGLDVSESDRYGGKEKEDYTGGEGRPEGEGSIREIEPAVLRESEGSEGMPMPLRVRERPDRT